MNVIQNLFHIKMKWNKLDKTIKTLILDKEGEYAGDFNKLCVDNGIIY